MRTCSSRPSGRGVNAAAYVSLATHQIASQSDQPLRSYRAITVYDTRHVARATCSGRQQSEEPVVGYEGEEMEHVSKGDRVLIGRLVS